jgi:hypothetical protein
LAGTHAAAPVIKGTLPFVGGTRSGFVTRPDVEALRVSLPEGQAEFAPVETVAKAKPVAPAKTASAETPLPRLKAFQEGFRSNRKNQQ